MQCGLYGFLIIKLQTALHHVVQLGHFMVGFGAVFRVL